MAPPPLFTRGFLLLWCVTFLAYFSFQLTTASLLSSLPPTRPVHFDDGDRCQRLGLGRTSRSPHVGQSPAGGEPHPIRLTYHLTARYRKKHRPIARHDGTPVSWSTLPNPPRDAKRKTDVATLYSAENLRDLIACVRDELMGLAKREAQAGRAGAQDRTRQVVEVEQEIRHIQEAVKIGKATVSLLMMLEDAEQRREALQAGQEALRPQDTRAKLARVLADLPDRVAACLEDLESFAPSGAHRSWQADPEQPADGNPDCSRRDCRDSRRPARGVAVSHPKAGSREYKPMAGGGGFEPPLTGSEPVVLPLDDPPAPLLPHEHTHYRNAVQHRQITRRSSPVSSQRARTPEENDRPQTPEWRLATIRNGQVSRRGTSSPVVPPDDPPIVRVRPRGARHRLRRIQPLGGPPGSEICSARRWANVSSSRSYRPGSRTLEKWCSSTTQAWESPPRCGGRRRRNSALPSVLLLSAKMASTKVTGLSSLP